MKTVDLTKNVKQRQLFDAVMYEVWKSENNQCTPGDYRYFFYGGGIRGGKTYVDLTILFVLAKKYPNSRSHAIRRSFPDIVRNLLPSAREILKYSNVRWKNSPADCYVEFSNGSRVYFMAEGFNQDPDLNRFKGLETNFILLEQSDELQHGTFQKAIERVGSWNGADGSPIPIILANFNPTSNWNKTLIYDKWVAGELKPPYLFIEALPDHNPFVTDEQWKNWQNMDELSYARFIKGQWDIPIEGQFCYSFNKDRNVRRGLTMRDNWEIILSFDFNVDPMTCIMAQTDRTSWSHIIREFRIENSDTYAMCEAIKPYIEGREHYVHITGDASGMNRMAGTRAHINQYEIIMRELRLKSSQFSIPSVNPFIADSRVFINSLLAKLPELYIDEQNCQWLIKDLQYCLIDTDRDGRTAIAKTGVNQHTGMPNSKMGHLLDCFRYMHHITFLNWLKWNHS